MNTKWVYEVTDLRSVSRKLEPVGEIRATPGGLNVWELGHAHPVFIPIDDDDPEALVDKEDEGHLEVATPEGRIIFQKFSMAQVDDIHAMFGNVPPLKSDDDVQRFFHQLTRSI